MKTALTKAKEFNAAADVVSKALHKLQLVCARNGEPLKSVSFTVREDGTTSTRFRHRRAK